ncbi:MAG TPA: urease accessory protein UreD [Candidatus Dormibacteraeota bacterium]
MIAVAPPQRIAASRIAFAAAAGMTWLARGGAAGPVRAVRGPRAASCAVTVVQARGGLCDGDRWRIEVDAAAGARARVRGAGATVVQPGTSALRTRLRAAAGAELSWRSAGVILAEGARARLTTVVDCDPRGRCAVSEVVAVHGARDAVLRMVIRRGGAVRYEERLRLDRDPRAPWRLGDATHLGTAVAAGRGARSRARRWEAALDGAGAAEALGPDLVLARALGGSLAELDDLLGPLVEEMGT